MTTEKEFIIWGKDKKNKEEYPLYTKCKNKEECLKVMEILKNKYKCYDLRVQIIDLNQNGLNEMVNTFKNGGLK
jgi:hypothetical protein